MNSIHTQNKHINLHALQEGLRDGIPIALGYLAVSFSLGIAAQAAGLTPFQGFLASITTNASAGEYACFMAISTGAAITELLLIMLITNGRYLLMSCSLSQKFSPGTPLRHRLLAAFAITDEIFGISIARGGYLNPYYMYGAILIASPCWALGTVLGIVAGNILPLRAVSALSVALYGMFLAVIVPPARKEKIIGVLIVVCFVLSFASEHLPVVSSLSSGTRTIILTLVISAAAAVIRPVKLTEEEKSDEIQ